MAKNDTSLIYDEAKVSEGKDLLHGIKKAFMDVDNYVYDAINKVKAANGVNDILNADFSIDLKRPTDLVEQSRTELKQIIDTLDENIRLIDKIQNPQDDKSDVPINNGNNNSVEDTNKNESYTKDQLLGKDEIPKDDQEITEKVSGVDPTTDATKKVENNTNQVPVVNPNIKDNNTVDNEIKNDNPITQPTNNNQTNTNTNTNTTQNDNLIDTTYSTDKNPNTIIGDNNININNDSNSSNNKSILEYANEELDRFNENAINTVTPVAEVPNVYSPPTYSDNGNQSFDSTTGTTSTDSNATNGLATSIETMPSSTNSTTTSTDKMTTTKITTPNVGNKDMGNIAVPSSSNRDGVNNNGTTNITNNRVKSDTKKESYVATRNDGIDKKVIAGAVGGAALLGAVGIGVAASATKKKQEKDTDESFNNNQAYYPTDENYNPN